MIGIVLAFATLLIALGLLGVGAFAWWSSRRRAPRERDAHLAAFAQSPNGMLLVDASTLQVVEANPALVTSLGIELEQLRGMPIGEIFGCADETAPDRLRAQLRESPSRLLVEARQHCRSGRTLNVELSGHRVEFEDRILFVLSTRDISLRRKVQAQQLERQQYLDHLAHHDQLTGLPNRLYLAAHLPKAIEEAQRVGGSLAVLFLDLDRFKHINDSRGHDVGDRLLQEVARRIRAAVRDDDMVVRMGGDEFIVVLREVSTPGHITETAARLADTLNVPVVIDGHSLVATASIGASVYPRDGRNMSELLRQSDTAMYQAKDGGRNTFQRFSPTMERKLRERVAIENGLRTALAERRLHVHYQPIVDIKTHRVVAVEALLRWRANHAFIRPNRFITVAEETGLIVPIGQFVARRALQDLRRWRDAGAAIVPVSFNVSAVQLQRSDFPRMLSRLLTHYDVEARMVQLELTESAMFGRHDRKSDRSRDAIGHLRDLGTRIAIDDFGTGYSSLSSLKRWRVDTLKIDRTFIRDLVMDPGDLAIVEAVIAMAQHLNIDVVAEGVESWPHLEKLRELRCDFAQGFLLAKPVPAEQCARLLTGAPLDFIAEDVPEQRLEATHA